MNDLLPGHFEGGRNLSTGNRTNDQTDLETVLRTVKADLDSIDSLTAGGDWKAGVDLVTAGALNAYTAAGSGVGKTLTQNAAAVENIDGVALVLTPFSPANRSVSA